MRKKICIMLVLVFVMSLFVSGVAFAKISNKAEFTVNEYEVLKNFKSKSEAELKGLGYSDEKIKKIKEFDYAKELRKRAKLSEKQLKALGYDEIEIKMLKNFKGTEEEISILSADVNCWYNVYDYWFTGTQTNFIANYYWEWTSKPLIDLFDDIIAFGWADQMRFDINYSYHKVKYKDISTGGSMKNVQEYASMQAVSVDTCKSVFDLQKSINGIECWAYEGYGKLKIYKSEKIDNVYAVYKYGHSTVSLTPSISGGGPSVGFGSNVETLDSVIIDEYLINY